jgi:DNA-binding FadR family transcriptional regulator
VLAGFGAPVARTTSTSEVAHRILAQVTNGTLTPGSRLPSERVLAESLKVGRSTVREALAALDLLGIIETRQGAGNFIRESSSDLLPQSIEWGLMLGRPRTLDLVEARHHLEIINAGLAAERGDEEQRERLLASFESMIHLAGAPADFVEADVAFHFEIASMAGNSVLSDILSSVRSLLQVWVTRAAAGKEHTLDTLNEHRAIMDAVINHDSDAARAAMAAHMDRAGARLQESIRSEAQAD